MRECYKEIEKKSRLADPDLQPSSKAGMSFDILEQFLSQLQSHNFTVYFTLGPRRA